jgi:hypothetical protein
MTDESMSPLRRRMIEDMTIRKFAPARLRFTKWCSRSIGRPHQKAAQDTWHRGS